MTEWITDANGNKNSVAYFGSREAAQAALDSLKNCRNCTNCSGCSRCSDCSDCSDCSRCSDCSGCSDCSDCSGCSDCSDCSGCSRCSGCSGCSDCSGCSKIAFCYNRKNLAPAKAAADATGNLGAPLVPVIPDIHKTIFAAVSQPGALDMGSWHTCEKTHCRAGWTVQLAGEAGRKLEEFHNTELAAMLIYGASGFQINPARFHDDNETALEDMRKLAEQATS